MNVPDKPKHEIPRQTFGYIESKIKYQIRQPNDLIFNR